jgi:hypothetical protein
MRSKFNLSHYRLTSFNQGQLIPVMAEAVLPGDLLQHQTEALLRVSPLVTPVMHPVHVEFRSFFVPNRIIWDDWEDFITGGDDGNDASVFPQITITPTEGSLAHHLGFPIGTSITVSALKFRAMAKIWNDYYRDPDLQTELTVDTTSGADTTTNTTLQYKCWEKDFFTTCRASEIKGDDVLLPIGTADVKTDVAVDGVMGIYSTDQSDYQRMDIPTAHLAMDGTTVASTSKMYVDATTSTMKNFLDSLAEYKFKKARARFGNGYDDYLRWLGVSPEDSRLKKAEYLGGGKNTISFSEIIQSAPTTSGSTAGVGDLKGHGISGIQSNRYKRFVPEHGIIMTLACVMPKTMYSQGVSYEDLKTTKEQFFQKEYQHTGQRAVTNEEVYAAHTTPTGEFGFQDKYDEYRQIPSRISGEFASTLNSWHMGREFSSDPALNAAFVKANPTNRVYASTSTDEIQMMAYHRLHARRIVAPRMR